MYLPVASSLYYYYYRSVGLKRNKCRPTPKMTQRFLSVGLLHLHSIRLSRDHAAALSPLRMIVSELLHQTILIGPDCIRTKSQFCDQIWISA